VRRTNMPSIPAKRFVSSIDNYVPFAAIDQW
jgi:hypothetical protein